MLADAKAARPDDVQFLETVETMLRSGDADGAATVVRARLEEVCGEDRPLPAHVLELTASDVDLVGWDALEEEIAELDECGEPVTAVAFDIVPETICPGEPALETSFFFDTAWPFSECDRDGLLEGYDANGTAWQSERADVDGGIVFPTGLEPLFRAIRRLGALEAPAYGDRPEGEENAARETARMLAGTYLSVLLHIAVRDKAARFPLTSESMPQGLAILVGAREFDPALRAPVCACIASPDKAIIGDEEAASDASVPEVAFYRDPTETLDTYAQATGPDETVLETCESDAEDTAGHEDIEVEAEMEAEAETDGTLIAKLEAPRRNLGEVFADPADDPEAWHLPPPDIHTTGTQLRRRLVSQDDIEELEASRPRTLMQRLRARFQPA